MVENLENEEPIQISIKTGNEIEELFDSFKLMYDEIKDYIERSVIYNSRKRTHWCRT